MKKSIILTERFIINGEFTKFHPYNLFNVVLVDEDT